MIPIEEIEPTERFGKVWPSWCPFCQAKRHEHGTYWFACGSFVSPKDKSKDKRSLKCKLKCKDRQISSLTEKLEAWRGLKPDLDFMDLEEGGRNEYFLDHDPIIKLRELGEVE